MTSKLIALIAGTSVVVGCGLLSINGKSVGSGEAPAKKRDVAPSESSPSPASGSGVATDARNQSSGYGEPAHAEGNLSAAQVEPWNTFVRDTQEALHAAEQSCGMVIPLVSDFENYDEVAWVNMPFTDPKESKPRPDTFENRKRIVMEYHSPKNACEAVLAAVKSSCYLEGHKSKRQPFIAKALKGVSCQFSAFKPRREQEGDDVWTARNLTLKDGVLTLGNNSIGFSNVELHAKIRLSELAASVGGPPAMPGYETSQNGGNCKQWSDCDSGVCAALTCQPCSATNICQKPGSTCHTGSCWTHAEMEATSAADAANQDKSAQDKKFRGGKGLGSYCGADSECNSAFKCKSAGKGRSTCQ